mgnify:CR=1 FL=1
MAPTRTLYYSSQDLIKKFKPALTTYFDVYINHPTKNINSPEQLDVVNFNAYEAVIPGSSFELAQVFGDRQGITEQYPTKRVYPPIDVSFYVDKDYTIIRFFEDWMASIHPNMGIRGNSFSKFTYPQNYETEVIITKYERDFWNVNERLISNPTRSGRPSASRSEIKYTLLNAYPTNIISMPVSYSQSDVLRTTVTFNYDLYSIESITNDGTSVDNERLPNHFDPTGKVQGP